MAPQNLLFARNVSLTWETTAEEPGDEEFEGIIYVVPAGDKRGFPDITNPESELDPLDLVLIRANRFCKAALQNRKLYWDSRVWKIELVSRHRDGSWSLWINRPKRNQSHDQRRPQSHVGRGG